MIANYRQAVPFAKNDPNTLLLLHGEEISDSSMYKCELQNSGVTVSSAQSKFGGSSLYFNGSSKIFLDAIEFGNSDFTIDWWEYCTGNGSRFSSSWTMDDRCTGLLLGYDGGTVWAASILSYNWDLISGAVMLSSTLSEWVHWAFVRSGTSLTSYRNGIQFATAVLNGTIYYDPSIRMAIGGYREKAPTLFNGYLDEFRISNIARWTENFTPPTEPY